MSPLTARIAAPGPKKILACDGGGIRGLMSVEILARLEAELRAAHGRPGLVLADFFDFTCGTSTGAIIAACISAGMSMDGIRAFYVGSGKDMFDKAFLLKRLNYQYNDEPLARKLRSELGRALGKADGAPALLGDEGLRTVLMMVMRNHTTDSPWFVSNNPHAKYNATTRPDCNLKLPLWKLVRASTAAPVYFPPEVVTLGEGSAREYAFIFVDGGVTTYNNPAFIAFEMATAAPYKLMWKTGVDDLLIVSIGTGKAPLERPDITSSDMNLLHHATTLPSVLMNAATDGWDMACRTLGDCRFGPKIDNEVDTMTATAEMPVTSSTPKLFTYVRYDPLLTRKGLDELALRDILPANVQQLDSVDHIPAIQRVGAAYGALNVKREHIARFMPG
jgi:patatin-like phospholipase/acyl hydrolase